MWCTEKDFEVDTNISWWKILKCCFRQQQVKINSCAIWGPQGSVLEPVLFLVYINDLLQCVKHSTLKLIADDTLLYITIANEKDSQRMQEDLQNLEHWEHE